jgi:hypothetical protein
LLSFIGSGKKLDKNHKDKISKSLKGKIPKNRKLIEEKSRIPIVGVRIIDREIFHFKSLEEAKVFLGLSNSSLISKCIRKERTQTHGFLFFYKDQFTCLDDIDFSFLNCRKRNKKKIIAHSINDKNCSLKFETMKQASEFLNVDRATLRRYCNEKVEKDSFI